MAPEAVDPKGASVPPGLDAPVAPLAEEYLAVLIISLATRLSRGAASHYLRHFGIGMADYRIVLALGLARGLNISAVAAAADVDKAAASRSLQALAKQGVVHLEQTSGRGRAAIVHLTDKGAELERQLRQSARVRERRLVAALTGEEKAAAGQLLRKLVAGVPHMNEE